jgi:uncharacterized protein
VAHFYFDSSALVKRYVDEIGTKWVRKICNPNNGHTIYTCRIGGAEIVAAFYRRVRMRSITERNAQLAVDAFLDHFQNQYQIVEVTPSLVEGAMNLIPNTNLRGYDAVQLAAALSLQRIRDSLGMSLITFVSADNDLNKLAKKAGLTVTDPLAT